MKYSLKLLALFYARLFLVIVFLIPILDFIIKITKLNSYKVYCMLCFILLLSALYLLKRVGSYEIMASPSALQFTKGVFFKKTIHIKKIELVSVSKLYTPLERKLRLVNLKLHLKGKSFLLFPIDESLYDEYVKTQRPDYEI